MMRKEWKQGQDVINVGMLVSGASLHRKELCKWVGR